MYIHYDSSINSSARYMSVKIIRITIVIKKTKQNKDFMHILLRFAIQCHNTCFAATSQYFRRLGWRIEGWRSKTAKKKQKTPTTQIHRMFWILVWCRTLNPEDEGDDNIWHCTDEQLTDSRSSLSDHNSHGPWLFKTWWKMKENLHTGLCSSTASHTLDEHTMLGSLSSYSNY